MCFEDDEQVYKDFLEILNMYGSKSIREVYLEVVPRAFIMNLFAIFCGLTV